MVAFTKTEHTLPWKTYQIYTWCLEPAELLPDSPTIVMMHGAGTADSTRAEGLAETYAGEGVRVISLDFVGHGKTGGAMSEMSLELRTEVAKAVIDHWTTPTEQLILCGASMSGHTVLRLTEQLGDRVEALSLLAPGVYAAEAEQVFFNEDFSNIIRVENSWQNSLALKDAQNFTGKVHLCMSMHDEVIPWGVAEHLLAAFRHNASEVRTELLQDPGHKIAPWLSARPSRGRDILHYLLNNNTDSDEEE